MQLLHLQLFWLCYLCYWCLSNSNPSLYIDLRGIYTSHLPPPTRGGSSGYEGESAITMRRSKDWSRSWGLGECGGVLSSLERHGGDGGGKQRTELHELFFTVLEYWWCRMMEDTLDTLRFGSRLWRPSGGHWTGRCLPVLTQPLCWGPSPSSRRWHGAHHSPGSKWFRPRS